MPVDELPLASPHLQVWPRVAWLMVVNRMHADGGAFAGRADFLDALREHDVHADPSRASRWESGQHPVPARVLGGYERVLGLGPGTLVALASVLARAGGHGASGAARGSDDAGPSAAVLEQLIERAAAPGPAPSPALAGHEWLSLTSELTRFEAVFLEAGTWTRLCDRLLSELARGPTAEALTRFEACTLLLGHTAGRPHLVAAVSSWLDDPDVQVVAPVVALLSGDASPVMNQLVLSLTESRSPRVREAALAALAAKLACAHFRRPALARVETVLAERLAGGRASAAVLAAVAQLPDDSRLRVLDRVRSAGLRDRIDHLNRTAVILDPDVARRLSRAIAGTLRAGAGLEAPEGGDAMLERLVMESLFHRSPVRRDLASLVLALSPFAEAMTEVCAGLGRGTESTLAGAAWQVLGWVGHSAERLVVDAALAEHRAGLQVLALDALRGSAAPLTEAAATDLARRASRPGDEGVALAATTALGLRAPDRVPSASASPAVARAASWWREAGAAVVDQVPQD